MANFITRNIPNTLTCGNLVSGCIATVMALGGDARYALIWIIIGAVFDFFDGMSARLFGVSSPIGKELDSLADDVTFGVAPSAIVFAQLSVMEYPTVLASVEPYIPYCAFLIAAFSALRLAKFNLDTRQTTSFIGMPTPANALFWGSLLVSQPTLVESSVWMIPAVCGAFIPLTKVHARLSSAPVVKNVWRLSNLYAALIRRATPDSSKPIS